MPSSSMRSMRSSVADIAATAAPRAITLVRLGVALFCAAAVGHWLGLWDVSARIARLPSLCLIRHLTGWDCPGCGMGRALALLAAGEPFKAWHRHPFALPFLAWMLGWALFPERFLGQLLQRLDPARQILPASACAVLVVWWIGARVL